MIVSHPAYKAHHEMAFHCVALRIRRTTKLYYAPVFSGRQRGDGGVDGSGSAEALGHGRRRRRLVR
jgi:hypothetical protein